MPAGHEPTPSQPVCNLKPRTLLELLACRISLPYLLTLLLWFSIFRFSVNQASYSPSGNSCAASAAVLSQVLGFIKQHFCKIRCTLPNQQLNVYYGACGCYCASLKSTLKENGDKDETRQIHAIRRHGGSTVVYSALGRLRQMYPLLTPLHYLHTLVLIY